MSSTDPASRREEKAARAAPHVFKPVWVGMVELSGDAPLEPLSPRPWHSYDRARILVLLHGDPLGFVRVRVPEVGFAAEGVRRLAIVHLGTAVSKHLDADGVGTIRSSAPGAIPGPETCAQAARADRRPISIVLSTRDRAVQLADALTPLKRLRYDAYEVVVVDNAPTSDATASCFERVAGDDPRFRYVVEPRPGLSRARNRGLIEASFDHVAFTDDDALVDPMWLHGIARGFDRDASVGCVTGLVPSAQLETVAQRYFDKRVWWSSRIDPHLYDLASPSGESKLFPYDAGRIGTGANFAVDRRLIDRLGGFDEGLGAGSPTLGGEDLDAFVRILRAGRSVAYEPSAIVWHIHRESFEELEPHLFGYGAGLAAYITKYVADPETRRSVLTRALHAFPHLIGLWLRSGDGGGHRSTLVGEEIRGMVAGPFAFRRARRDGWGPPQPPAPRRDRQPAESSDA